MCRLRLFLSCQPVSPEGTQLQRRLETETRRERENLNLLKEVQDTDPILERDYQRSREWLAGLRGEYNALGEALKPKAIRMKWERSYIPKGSTNRPVIITANTPIINSKANSIYNMITPNSLVANEPMVVFGKMTSFQISVRHDMAKNLTDTLWANEKFILAINLQFKFEKLPSNLDNIFIAESRIPKGSIAQIKSSEAKLLKEIKQIQVLTKNGNTMFFTPEPAGKKITDGVLNGWVIELKSMDGGRNRIGHSYSDALKKLDPLGRKPNLVFLNILNPSLTENDAIAQFRSVLNRHKDYDGYIMARFINNGETHLWNTKDLR